jgi:enterochelin esterase-like enzyme
VTRTLLTVSCFFLAAFATAQQPRPIVSPKVADDGKVTFSLRAPKAEKVTLNSGEMQPVLKNANHEMSKGDDGVWTVTLGPLPPGIYDYTYNVDGVVMTDPSSPDVFGNRRGSRGFVEVPGPKGKPRHDEWRDVPHGSVSIHWYDSKVSGTRRRVHVYTPPGYGKDASRKYPVLYLLHGSGDNDSHWMHIGRANVIADNAIADGKAVPMVVVMPDGHVVEGPRNDERARQDRRVAFEKDLLEHVVPLVESTYSVERDAKGRALTGLSMGGGQSLGVGLKHIDKFAWVGGFSSGVSGRDSVLEALKADPKKANEQLKLLWIGIGKEDFLLEGNRAFVAALKDMKLEHKYEETPGAHRWSVWRLYLADFLPKLFH